MSDVKIDIEKRSTIILLNYIYLFLDFSLFVPLLIRCSLPAQWVSYFLLFKKRFYRCFRPMERVRVNKIPECSDR